MKSPRRDLGGPADAWRLLLLGEIVRALDVPVRVRADVIQRLPNSGRWERGLAQLRPAMDDVLGATAFSVAWRWACAGLGRNAWPGVVLVCGKAVDHPVTPEAGLPVLADAGVIQVVDDGGERSWVLEGVGSIGVRGAWRGVDWTEVDRIADVASAWLDVPWRVVEAER